MADSHILQNVAGVPKRVSPGNPYAATANIGKTDNTAVVAGVLIHPSYI